MIGPVPREMRTLLIGLALGMRAGDDPILALPFVLAWSLMNPQLLLLTLESVMHFRPEYGILRAWNEKLVRVMCPMMSGRLWRPT